MLGYLFSASFVAAVFSFVRIVIGLGMQEQGRFWFLVFSGSLVITIVTAALLLV